MNYQYFDLLQFLILVLCAIFAYKVKNNYIRFIPIGLLLLAFIFVPVNMTEKNTTMKFTTTQSIPDKIVVDKEHDFDTKQKIKLEQLEQQSKEKLNETID